MKDLHMQAFDRSTPRGAWGRERISQASVIVTAVFLAASLTYVLNARFYFYQVVAAAILVCPLLLFGLHAPRACLLALFTFSVAINPAIHLRRDPSFDFYMGLKFWASDLCLLALLAYGFLSRAMGKRPLTKAPTPWEVFLPLIGWLTAALLSIVPAVNPAVALWGGVRIVRILAIFLTFYWIVEKPQDLRLIVTCLLLVFAIQSLWIVVEYGAGHPLGRLPGGVREADVIPDNIFRPGGSMGHSSNFGKLAALCLPLTLTVVLAGGSATLQIGTLGILILGSLALVLSLSRIGMVTSVWGIVLALIVTHRLWIFRHRAVFLVACIAVAGGFGAWRIGGQRIVQRIQDDHGSMAARGQMFSVAWEIIKAHPFRGVGLNNSTLVAPDYDKTRENISVDWPHPIHNIYLLSTAELGLGGGLCFIGWVGAAAALPFRYARRTHVTIDRLMGWGMGIGLIGCWLQGLVDWGHWSSVIHLSYTAMLAGAFAACVGRVSGDSQEGFLSS